MTALVIAAALVFGWYWTGVWHTSVVSGELTVYVLAFVAGLAMASMAALVAWTRPLIIAAVVLIAHFAAAHYAWQAPDPKGNGAVQFILIAAIDLVAAAYFILAGRERWEWAIGAVFLCGVGIAALTALGAIPSHLERPPVFLAFSFPDLSSLVGHVASILLGAGSGDWGKLLRITDRLRVPVPWAREGALMRRVL